MDFKVCGTRDGITAIQLDIKIEGIDYKIIRDTLHRAKEARLTFSTRWPRRFPPRAEKISKWAPRLLTVKIDPEKIGKLIGPGGKNIKKLQEDTGAHIDIEDDGTVYISRRRRRRREVPRYRRGDDRRGEGRQDLHRHGRQHQGFRRVRRNRPRNRWPCATSPSCSHAKRP
jgi:polyribonucleotide nucleotidyltransferase